MVLTVSVVRLLFDSVHPREDGEYILQAIDVTVLSPRSFITESGTETITEPLLAWTFLDEKHLLIIKDYNNIPEILARFYEKKGRIGNELLSQ